MTRRARAWSAALARLATTVSVMWWSLRLFERAAGSGGRYFFWRRRFGGGGRRRDFLSLLWLAQLDPDRVQPAANIAIDRWRAQRDIFIQPPVDRVQDERLRLRTTQSAMRSNQLLKRRHFAKLRIVLTDEQEVRRVRH